MSFFCLFLTTSRKTRYRVQHPHPHGVSSARLGMDGERERRKYPTPRDVSPSFRRRMMDPFSRLILAFLLATCSLPTRTKHLLLHPAPQRLFVASHSHGIHLFCPPWNGRADGLLVSSYRSRKMAESSMMPGPGQYNLRDFSEYRGGVYSRPLS